ncbi:MAG: AI-2E family transporter [Microbacteriaceae bacterium]
MRIQNPFRLGLLAGLGVLLAIIIGQAIGSLATILTYIFAAIFLALGLDPFVTWLEKKKIKRPVAILIALVAVLGVFAGLILALIPVIVEQVSTLTDQIANNVVPGIQNGTLIDGIKESVAFLDPTTVDTIFSYVQKTIEDPALVKNITNGLVGAGIGIANGVFGVIIVVILMIYFVSSLANLKRGLYRMVPASKRESFIDLAEQISISVGRYVMGQATLALINGVVSFFLLQFLFQVQYAALLAFIAFLGSLIPLVGTLSASVIIVLSTLAFNIGDTFLGTPLPQFVAVAVWYLVYMQIEAYVLNPRIMTHAVQVPGVVVVIAALVGGTLLGILGALVAIPVAAAIQLIVKEVVIPRQNEL